MANILVTGINGFVGQHMAHELHRRNHAVIGVAHTGPVEKEIASLLQSYHVCDLTSPEAVQTLPLRNIDAVINLAGLAKVGDSFNDPEAYKSINVAVFSVLAEQLYKNRSHARILAVSTGAVYDPNQPMPLDESSKIISQGSPYADSKLLMEDSAKDYRQKGLDCIVARPFNHSGPGQKEGFLIPDLYKNVLAAHESGTPLLVGNLATKRDYTDVRDIVRAYADLIDQPSLTFDVYNICAGSSHSGREILELLLEISGLHDMDTKVDPSLLRPNDPPDLYGSHDQLTQETNWQPTIPFEQTMRDFVTSIR